MKITTTAIFLSLVLAFIASGASAQINRTDSTLIFFTNAQIDSALNPAVATGKIGRFLGVSKDIASYMVGTRSKAGDVEIHEHWDDIAIIRSGSGVLRTGRVVTGQVASGVAPTRDWLGGEIKDVKERALSPGDFIVIPAMMAHQYIPKKGQTLTYWTIKVPRP